MNLSSNTLVKLRELINEDTVYRSGPVLVKLFNQLGFNDVYGQGFPSRASYTDSRLQKINNTSDIDKCLKIIFSPINFLESPDLLTISLDHFNRYLGFDGWNIFIEGKEVKFKRILDKDFDIFNHKTTIANTSEEDFLMKSYEAIHFSDLELEIELVKVLDERIKEVESNMTTNSPLSVLFLCGSIMEGLLFGMARKYPKEFNQAQSSIKNKEGKVISFGDWSLSDFINTASEIGVIKNDVKKFSHVLREYRNYIHPYQQYGVGFAPTMHTAKICLQVLNATFDQAKAFQRSKL